MFNNDIYQQIENIQKIILNICLKNTHTIICGNDILSKTSRLFYVKTIQSDVKEIQSNIITLNEQIPYLNINIIKINKVISNLKIKTKQVPKLIPNIKITIQKNYIQEILSLLKLYNYYHD